MADGYEVIDQQQTVGLLPDRTYGPVMRVTFRTSAGVVMMVDVPIGLYNVDNVRAAIEERVAHANEVSNL